MGRRGKLVVVANRLPVHRVRRGKEHEWRTSPGGLVSALTPFLRDVEGTWVGWPGFSGAVPRPFQHEGILNVGVPITRKELAGYYEGFSNGTLWPLYHDCVRPPEYRRRWWKPYVDINRRFAAMVDRVAARGSSVWVQDYHLQLVPGILRARRPDLRIGFFLHIPFPPQELFGQLPWRRAILEGLLGADVVGFQTRVGSMNFGQLARRYARARGRGGVLEFEGRIVRHGSFPISIDFQRFDRQARAPETIERARVVRGHLGQGRRILLGVDRLDYTKGIDVRLRAFQELMESGSATLDDCVLVQTAVPSRENVGAYRREKQHIERLVGEINGEFGSIGRTAVHYLHKTMPFEELVAMYLVADVMMVTPLRDGMNLVAKEYVASRPDERGALVLSEFTGAARELRPSLLVNPYDVDGLAARMLEALEMSESEQRRRMRLMRQTVRTHDVFLWARSFLEALEANPA